MDVNLTADVKGFGVPATPAVEREQRAKPQVTPVDAGGDSSKAALDERALRKQEALSTEEVNKMVEQVQEKLDAMGTRLNFTLSEDPDAVVVQVTDKESGELVKQFPPEEVLALRKKLDELVGLLFDGKA